MPSLQNPPRRARVLAVNEQVKERVKRQRSGDRALPEPKKPEHRAKTERQTGNEQQSARSLSDDAVGRKSEQSRLVGRMRPSRRQYGHQGTDMCHCLLASSGVWVAVHSAGQRLTVSTASTKQWHTVCPTMTSNAGERSCQGPLHPAAPQEFFGCADSHGHQCEPVKRGRNVVFVKQSPVCHGCEHCQTDCQGDPPAQAIPSPLAYDRPNRIRQNDPTAADCNASQRQKRPSPRNPRIAVGRQCETDCGNRE